MMPRHATENASFETKMQQLNQLVEKMETGNLSLEDALKYFEQGIALTRECQKDLQQAEQKIEILMKKNADFTLTPFSPDDTDDNV
jgi:exodeoxyribonuclease VII small subunit